MVCIEDFVQKSLREIEMAQDDILVVLSSIPQYSPDTIASIEKARELVQLLFKKLLHIEQNRTYICHNFSEQLFQALDKVGIAQCVDEMVALRKSVNSENFDFPFIQNQEEGKNMSISS